jgi:hypothetical protein
MKRCVSLLFALFLLVSCSEADPTSLSSAPTPSAGSDEVASRGDKTERDDAKEQPKGKKKGDRQEDKDGSGAGDEGNGSTDAGSTGGSSTGGASGDGADAFNDSGSEDDHSSAVYPAAGRYNYSQRGYEKFCSGGTCERQALAKRQTAVITLRSRSAERAEVVTETSASDDRMLRTTTTYSRADARVTDVYTRLSYKGFAFENQYHPSPPVESLRFPLRDGAAWRGSWEDSTSGDYSVRVFGPASVTVAGRAVRAWQVATTTDFRGEFNGRAKTLSWIDPATKAIVKLSGSIDVTSTYGRYVTEFSTSLRSGPRY